MKVEEVRETFEPIARFLGKSVEYCFSVYAILWQWKHYGLFEEPATIGLMRLMPEMERKAFVAAFKGAGLLDKDGHVVDVFGWSEK